MLSNDLNKEWKIDYFRIFSTEPDNTKELEKADKLKFEHFPPVIGNFYEEVTDEDRLRKICQGKLEIRKAKLSQDYNENILKTDYEKNIKTQLNQLMNHQIAKLNQEDPNFLQDDEKEIIESSEFPFIKLMTLVYAKDTNMMSTQEQEQWKENMNGFINQQIVFTMVNTYYTMKLYRDNNYTRMFQTPYNKQEVWDKYADNGRGFLVAYDFKEIKESVARNLKKIYPVLYTDRKLDSGDLDFDVYNTHSALLTKAKAYATEYDNEWIYIHNHHYTESEYMMLDNLLEPVYTKTTSDEKIQEILKSCYLKTHEGKLDYDYRRIINDLTDVLDSPEFNKKIAEGMEKVFEITENTIDIDFMKPEAIYIGTDFPEERVESYREVTESENVRIFRIKQKDDQLYKANIW